MKNIARIALTALSALFALSASAAAQSSLLPFTYEEKSGKLFFQVPQLDHDFLYLTSLASGLGSNALGLDRGTTGDAAVVRFQRAGNKLLLIRRNLGFRATRGDAALQHSVEESFATSVLAAFPIQSETAGVFTIDATDFLLQDVVNVRGTIQGAQQGSYRLDRNRSAIYLPRTKSFPKNTEVEVLLTFESDNPGREVDRHTPDGRSLTLREHHSFVELPDSGYVPREFDPRIGVFATSFFDFSRPLRLDPQVRWINRWRLQKKDPNAAISDPVKPIVYYLDRGVPEPYRTAFKQGAAWWAKAFEAAGFSNAFRVDDLPPDVDPLDARYSIIQWVHRSDPGFSVGQEFEDPWTGEIIKAALKMDTYRSMTDFNIFAGMVPAISEQNEDWIASLDPNVNGTEFAMARRRQHIAHEIGHTLGLAHNYISHAYGRASVMDYPGPLVTLRKDGTVDVSSAYRPGIGSYDSLAIRWAYAEYRSPAEEKAGLAAIVREAIDKGIRFLSDTDAEIGLTPEVTRWLNGSDAIAELERQTAVRAVLMSKFDERVIAMGDPMWNLNRRFVPVYLHHRYAIEAAVKAIGGVDYSFALRGDRQTPATVISPGRQRAALRALTNVLQPGHLAIPERIVALIPPAPYGYRRDAWSFDSPAGAVFDPIGIARALADYVVAGVLQPQRLERVNAFYARNPQEPSVTEITDGLADAVFANGVARNANERALLRASRRAVVDGLIDLAANPRATADVKAAAEFTLGRLAARLSQPLAAAGAPDSSERAANTATVRDIRNWLDKRIAPARTTANIQLPPGTPIGN